MEDNEKNELYLSGDEGNILKDVLSKVSMKDAGKVVVFIVGGGAIVELAKLAFNALNKTQTDQD